MSKPRFEVGDEVHGWGIGFGAEYFNPGKVTRVQWDPTINEWVVDWHNELARHALVPESSLMLASEPYRIRGPDGILPLTRTDRVPHPERPNEQKWPKGDEE